MNKRFVKLLGAGILTVTMIAPVALNAAQPMASMEDSSASPNLSRDVTMDTKHSSGIFDTNSPDAENPNGNGDQQAGPKISVKKDKFLLKKGASFDFATELGLSIVDATDGDITSQLKIPSIDTSKATTMKKTVKAVNSKGEVSTLEIVIRVVDVKSELELKDAKELDTYDLSKLVNDASGLTLAVKSIADDKSSFVVTITDGANTMEQTVALKTGTTDEGTGKPDGDQTGKPDGETPKPEEDSTPKPEGETPKPEEDGTGKPDDETTKPPTNNGSGNGTGNGGASLPETGAVASGLGLSALIAGGAGAVYFKKRR